MVNDSVIAICDANIFIDIAFADLMNELFALNFEIHTTDFVMHELKKPEHIKKMLMEYEKGNLLTVKSFSAKEISDLYYFHPDISVLSITDKSVWKYAKNMNSRLLTNDMALRKYAENDDIAVSGSLYIFDQFIEQGIISAQPCAEKLEYLPSRNSRLPKDECDKRIRLWKEF